MQAKQSNSETFLGTDQVHLGLTTRCNLQCPFCARTYEKNRWFGKGNIDLDINYYKNFISSCDIKQILLCGNYGDPIFYPQLFELIKFAKSYNIIIKMHTNGSGHNDTWWKELSSILTKQDRIFFSIDGIEENFTTYRIGASWSKIIRHINIVSSFSSRPRLVWKYILFKYNEHTVLDAIAIAQKLGMDQFLLNSPFYAENEKDKWAPTKDIQNYIIPENYEIITESKDAIYINIKS